MVFRQSPAKEVDPWILFRGSWDSLRCSSSLVLDAGNVEGEEVKRGELYRDAAGTLWLVAARLPAWFVHGRADRYLLVRKRTEFQRRLDMKIHDPLEDTNLLPVESSEEARKEVLGHGV